MYENVALLDVASMHPTSIEELNIFGKYTPNFSDLLKARIAIKHEDYASARKMLGGKLAPYLVDETQAKALSYALKIAINIVYGLTSAKFDNPFNDKRNIDNIVAKRGALFMMDLRDLVQAEGYTVAHIKTDSIKIPDADQHIIDIVTRFGEKYGYTFEHEATYEKFCLVNDAVYIAKKLVPVDDHEEHARLLVKPEWIAVGAQFQHPYVYKTLFTHEPLEFNDLCETKSVLQGVMYLDFEGVETPMALTSGHMQHVGKTGSFVPVLSRGGFLYRVKDDKKFAVTGTKGYLWMEAEIAQELGDLHNIDMSYFENLATEARNAIDYYGSFKHFAE